jgi:hypothetical protein
MEKRPSHLPCVGVVVKVGKVGEEPAVDLVQGELPPC